MSRGTQIKDAIAQWEQKEGCKVDEVDEAKLYAMFIEKMDSSMSQLSHVTKLSLSTNCIEKIANLNGFKNLRILSLGRNNIKNFIGLEVVADTLEQLWISYNKIERLTGIRYMKALKVLYISNNNIADWDEMRKLCELQHLEDILFANNPVEERYSAEGTWRDKIASLLPKLRKLDGVPVIRLDDERFGLEKLNLDDNVLQGGESPTKLNKTRPNTRMSAKPPKTPDAKSARDPRSARGDGANSSLEKEKDEGKNKSERAEESTEQTETRDETCEDDHEDDEAGKPGEDDKKANDKNSNQKTAQGKNQKSVGNVKKPADAKKGKGK